MTRQAYNIDLPVALGIPPPGAGQTRALLKPIQAILSDAPRLAREHFLAATREALRLDATPAKPRQPTTVPARSLDGLRTAPRAPVPDGVTRYVMARDLAGTIFPVSEDSILREARKHGIGRKMGRAIILALMTFSISTRSCHATARPPPQVAQLDHPRHRQGHPR